jgi:hypothetical protein
VRRDDVDATPKKKSGKLLLILGLLGGVLILGCGTCGGIGYYFYRDTAPNPKLTEGNVALLREGMTQSEIEVVLGPGKKLSSDDFAKMTVDDADLTRNYINEQHRKYWTAWVDRGLVTRWGDGKIYVLVAYNNPPESDGRLKGLSYQFLTDTPTVTIHNEKFPLPRNPSADDDAVRLGIARKPDGVATNPIRPKENPTPPKVTPKASSPGDAKENPIRVSPAELLASPKRYERKWLTIFGTVADLDHSSLGFGAYLLTPDGMKSERRHVRCGFGESTFTQALVAGPGDALEVTGRWYRGEPNEPVELLDCELVSVKKNTPTVSAVEITREYNRDPAAADTKYRGKIFRITGSVLETKPQGPGDGFTLRGLSEIKKKSTLRVSAPCLSTWKSRFEAKRVGQSVIVVGEVIGFSDGVVKLGDCWLLTR